MPRNDDGEFELILGNRQLMSVFFIVVILLGIFFAMGYIVGRNSSPVGPPEVASTRPAPGKSAATDAPASERTTPADAPKETPPRQPSETASQQGPATRPAPPPEPAPAPKASSRASTAGEPQSGKTYLQISAVDRDKAEIYVERLRKQNFSAIMAEIPEKPGVFRVLVGPVPEADLNKIRADLQNASFPGKEAVKRTF